jgi:hypothetical protein
MMVTQLVLVMQMMIRPSGALQLSPGVRRLRPSYSTRPSACTMVSFSMPRHVASPYMLAAEPTPRLQLVNLFPLLTIGAAAIGQRYPGACTVFGSARSFQAGLSLLIFSMGLTRKRSRVRTRSNSLP